MHHVTYHADGMPPSAGPFATLREAFREVRAFYPTAHAEYQPPIGIIVWAHQTDSLTDLLTDDAASAGPVVATIEAT